jgi:hypothetical protein
MWLAHFLPDHPWRGKPQARTNTLANTGLSDRQVDVALAEFAARERMRPEVGKARGAGWHAWLHQVLSTKVELLPAGRAVLIDPIAGIGVSFRFEPTGKRRGDEPFLALSSVEIKSSSHPPTLPPENVDMTTLFAAFRIDLERIEANSPKKRTTFYSVADRPQPGKPAKLDYYFSLLAEQEGLKAQGHSAPDRELAERYGVKRSTLRGHLKKARDIRAEREQEKRK